MKPAYLVIVAAAMLLFAAPTSLESCAISAPAPLFTTTSGPADPRGEFFQGRIGVIVPSFERSYLIASYRYFSGRTFSAEEADAFLGGQHGTIAQDGSPGSYLSALGFWIQTRQALQPPAPPGYLNPYKSQSRAGLVGGYQNCLGGAFYTATETLRERGSRWGHYPDSNVIQSGCRKSLEPCV